MTRQYNWYSNWYDKGTGPLPSATEPSHPASSVVWRDKPSPPWTAAIMPNDALPPDSLVGRMLGVEEINKALLANETGPFDPGEPPPPATVEPMPLTLWQVLAPILDDCIIEALCDLDDPDVEPDPYHPERRQEVFEVIKGLRDWLLPDEHEPPMVRCSDPTADELVPRELWRDRQRLRALLTAEARIARGES